MRARVVLTVLLTANFLYDGEASYHDVSHFRLGDTPTITRSRAESAPDRRERMTERQISDPCITPPRSVDVLVDRRHDAGHRDHDVAAEVMGASPRSRRSDRRTAAPHGEVCGLERSWAAWHAAAMRQYLVVGLGILVLVVGLVAKSYLGKQAPAAGAPIDTLVRAGLSLREGLAGARPAEHAGLEPRFAAVATACAGLGGSPKPEAKQLCERAEVLRQAAKSGTSTAEGARDVQQAMDALASAVAPAR